MWSIRTVRTFSKTQTIFAEVLDCSDFFLPISLFVVNIWQRFVVDFEPKNQHLTYRSEVLFVLLRSKHNQGKQRLLFFVACFKLFNENSRPFFSDKFCQCTKLKSRSSDVVTSKIWNIKSVKHRLRLQPSTSCFRDYSLCQLPTKSQHLEINIFT